MPNKNVVYDDIQDLLKVRFNAIFTRQLNVQEKEEKGRKREKRRGKHEKRKIKR